MANRLIKSQSPYLQQHKEDAVNWYEWDDEAFEKAKKEDKLIFLSIGYSSCHWCHVMQKEVFQNEEIAKYLNQHFISIKVDKEERPDIDRYYQEVYQLLNQRPGGWPLSIFLTPDKKPFFAATYIPPTPKYSMPGFLKLIQNMVEIYKKNPKEITQQADEILKYLKPTSPKKAVRFDEKIAQLFVESVKRNFDKKFGGFSDKPKFPHSSTINTLLAIYRLHNNKEALEMTLITLKNMAKGGLRDIIDGGFCRYSTDKEWLVPHFEKMTYDNALLMQSYLEAYFCTKEEFYKDIAFEIAKFMSEYMRQKGLFFSASDADSEGVEGKYFIFEYDEIVKKLKEDGFSDKEISEVLKKLNITKRGNFSGKNIPRFEDFFICETTKKAIKSLKEIRKKRCYPFIDKKIITSSNAMMIRSLYIAARIDYRYFEIAEESMKSLLDTMYIDEHLYHSTIIGEKPKIKAFLEDYAYLATALLEGYKTTLNEEYLAKANLLVNDALIEFFEEGKWYFSKNILIEAEYSDTSYPSSAAVIVDAMLTLGSLLDEKYIKFSFDTIEYYSEKIYKNLPWAAKFVEDILRFIHKDKIIKSTPSNLTICSAKIDFVKYPFKLLKTEEHQYFMLCDTKSCFKKSGDCKDILKDLDG